MKRLLKAEWFKFTHSYYLLIMIGVLSACCGVSILTGSYNSAEATLMSLTKDSMVPILACAIYSAVVVTDDFSNGMLRRYVSNGYTRPAVICAKFVHYIGGCTWLLLLYPMVSTFTAAIVQGVETSLIDVLQAILLAFIKPLPLYWGIFSLFFLFSVLLEKGVLAMGTSIASAIILVVFTNKFYENAAGILKYSPVIQIHEIAGGRITEAYFISIFVSLAFLAVCVLVSIAKFQHEEL